MRRHGAYVSARVKLSVEDGFVKYFAKENNTNLPDPCGAPSREVPSSAILSATKEVQKIDSSSESSEPKKRGLHSKSFSPQVKAEIGKYEAELLPL